MKIGWWRILGVIVLSTIMPGLVRAQEYESIVAPHGDLGSRLDGALGRMSSSENGEVRLEGTSSQTTKQRLVGAEVQESYDDGGDGPAPVKSSGQLIENGLWYGDTDFTVMSRTRAHRQFVLGVDAQENRGITTRDRPMGIEPGAGITVGRYFPRDDENRDRSFEFTFQGLNTWDVDDSLRSLASGGVSTFLGDTFGGFRDADVFTTHYHSTYNSYEFNYRIGDRLGRDRLVLQPDGCWHRECEPSPIHTVLFGLRMIEIDEKFQWLSRRDDLDVGQYRGDYFIDTQNTLLGLQFGLECYDQYCNWNWGIKGKGGIYSNFASQSTHVQEKRPNTIDLDREFSQSEPVVAFVGDVGLIATYQITPRWSIHTAYDFMFIQDLALAPEQLTFNLDEPSPQIADHGWIFYQSLTIGVEYVW